LSSTIIAALTVVALHADLRRQFKDPQHAVVAAFDLPDTENGVFQNDLAHAADGIGTFRVASVTVMPLSVLVFQKFSWSLPPRNSRPETRVFHAYLHALLPQLGQLFLKESV